jgi:hypothetical protein
VRGSLERDAITIDDAARTPFNRRRMQRRDDDLRTDSGRIAERDAERRGGRHDYEVTTCSIWRFVHAREMRRALLLALLGGCAGAEAMTMPAPTPPTITAQAPVEFGLTPGETMAFEVHLGGMLAGEAQLAVGQPGMFEGHHAVVVTSRAQTAGAAKLIRNIVDQATTTIDMDTGRPLQLDTMVVMGDKTTTAQAKFTGSIANVTYSRNDDPKPHTYRVDFGKVTVHDSHSAMAQMRGWKAAPGAVNTVYVVGGRRLWRVDVHMIGTETINSQVGNRRAVHYNGAAFRAKPNLTLESEKPARTF